MSAKRHKRHRPRTANTQKKSQFKAGVSSRPARHVGFAARLFCGEAAGLIQYFVSLGVSMSLPRLNDRRADCTVNHFLTTAWRSVPQFGTLVHWVLQTSPSRTAPLSAGCVSKSRPARQDDRRHDLPSLKREIGIYFCCRTDGKLPRGAACSRWTRAAHPCSGL